MMTARDVESGCLVAKPSLAEFQREITLRMARGEWASASEAAAACREAWPLSNAGWLLGSFVALAAGEKDQALRLVDERLAIDPTDLRCLLQRAESLLALARKDEALAAAETASNAPAGGAAALDAVGTFYVYAQEHARARAAYDRALAAAPGNALLLTRRALLHRYLGDFELAAQDYDAVLAQRPADAEALKGRAELQRQSEDRNALPAMEAALAAGPANIEDAVTLHFGLAKSYDDLGDHAASWRHLMAGNGLERTRLQYDSGLDRAVIGRIIAAFPSPEPTCPDTTGERPIFIVGLPRTGTTLVERILGSHSQVHPAGEALALSEAISAALDRKTSVAALDWLGFADWLGRLDGAPIAREYLERVQLRRGNKPRFVDKQTLNFNYCALIFRAFPQARIVHVTRHPLAACYAIFKTRFPGTFPFAYHLTELADYYVGYRQLMAHWHRVLPGRILDLAYEDIVTAQEPTTRRLLEYVGLAFEPACLEFHRNTQAVMTASSVQVRQPLYDGSLDQWRRYAAELTPVRERLQTAGIAVA